MPTICIEEGCSTRANFNQPGEKTGLYCKRHIKGGMVDVKNIKCEILGCSKRPNFNKRGENKPICCSDHKTDDMIDIVHPPCKEDHCQVRPSYGMPGKKSEYCYTHKKEGMIDLVSLKCEEERCLKRPSFNVEGETVGRYCKQHKKVGMIDVSHYRCDRPACNLQPGYIDPKTGKKYCSGHKTLESITRIRKCESPDCDTIPTYAKPGEKSAIRCVAHKRINIPGEEDDVDIKHQFCKTSLCGVRAIDKYDGYCMRCHVHNNPDLPNARNYKTKETVVSHYIKIAFPDISFISDKRIVNGCSKRRPDDMADLGTHLLIVETDENKHDTYDCSCENKRIMELSRDVGHRPIVFIRFNPDKYVDSSGRKISSCWDLDGRGMAVVKKERSGDWEKRLLCLKGEIRYWIDNIPEKTVETIQLFYDGMESLTPAPAAPPGTP